MDILITFLGVLSSILCLIPLVLYLVGIRNDPFHPLILVGLVMFNLTTYKTVQMQNLLLVYFTSQDIQFYLVVVILSLLSVYVGYTLTKPTIDTGSFAISAAERYNDRRLTFWSLLFGVVGATVFFFFHSEYTMTGFLRDLGYLWMAGAVLAVQLIILSPRMRPIALFILAVSITHPVGRFFAYGQRGDTLRMAMLLVTAYLCLGRRPRKIWFVTAAVFLAVVMTALPITRHLMSTGEASGRIDALWKVGPAFFTENVSEKQFTFGEEYLFGIAAIKTARVSGIYGYGRVFYVAFPLRFLPKEFFEWKYAYYYNHISFDRAQVPIYAGVPYIAWGAAPTGMAEAYVELWWLFPLLWGFVGMILKRLYTRACVTNDLINQGLYVGFTVGLIYFMTQEILFALMNLVYVMLPLAIAYRHADILRHSAKTTQPALATSY